MDFSFILKRVVLFSSLSVSHSQLYMHMIVHVHAYVLYFEQTDTQASISCTTL